MAERKLVTVEPILAVEPIAGADSIETVKVRGWTVVTRKGEFAPGDLCVYFEIDAFLPVDDARFAPLASRGTKTMEVQDRERTGHVLRTAKLRGVISQGLALPVSAFPELKDPAALADAGTDVADELGVSKYEAPISADLAGVVVGSFPTQFAPKTDAERIQNLVNEYAVLRKGARWLATEKVDGTSVTLIRDEGRLRVCSRNLELVAEGTTQAQLAKELGWLAHLEDDDAVQAELFGEGIRKNPLKIRGQRLAVFAMWRARKPLPRAEWPEVIAKHAAPRYDDLTLPATAAEAIAQADGICSLITPGQLAEGIVWHAEGGELFEELDDRSCFKVISNKWLLKHES